MATYFERPQEFVVQSISAFDFAANKTALPKLPSASTNVDLYLSVALAICTCVTELPKGFQKLCADLKPLADVGNAILQIITVLTAFQVEPRLIPSLIRELTRRYLKASFTAARSLFEQTLTKVSRAPFRYYDTTPTGRIINRFSSDFGLVDTAMTDQARPVPVKSVEPD